MKHPSEQHKALLKKLAFLQENIALFCKMGERLPSTAPKSLIDKLEFLQKRQVNLQQQLENIAEQLPSPSPLDPLYEEVIEWGKRPAPKAPLKTKRLTKQL